MFCACAEIKAARSDILISPAWSKSSPQCGGESFPNPYLRSAECSSFLETRHNLLGEETRRARCVVVGHGVEIDLERGCLETANAIDEFLDLFHDVVRRADPSGADFHLRVDRLAAQPFDDL